MWIFLWFCSVVVLAGILLIKAAIANELKTDTVDQFTAWFVGIVCLFVGSIGLIVACVVLLTGK